ncbi:MAG: type IV pilus assembly protein PilM [Armatimonadetes bacterium]|nr:type IV pilus assembly protein PilM [Armatimonadota bacterium]MBS1727461.1 type IV pilus assembly protein PilM [Armatimonadota bacterium]
MASKLSSVLGIDIGSQSIKVCEVKASGGSATVTAVGVVPTPEGAVDYSGVYNSEAVGNALKQIISQVGASSSSAVVTIAGQHSVLVRVIDVPRMDPDKELKSHMEWEINKNIPFAETTIMSDYKVLPSADPNSANMEVVMAMAPQSAIDTILDCIKRSGKKPVAIDVEPLGIARSVAASYPEFANESGVVVVDIGHSTTCINVYERNNLVLPRPVPGGGEMVTKAIADAMQTGVQEAETYKCTSFSVPDSATSGGGGMDPFSVGGATQAFDAGFGGTYQAGAPMADTGATTGMPAQPDLDIDPVTGLPVTGASPAYTNDPFAVADTPSAPNPNETVAMSSAPVVQQPAGDHVFSAVQGILDDLVAELRRSIDYYNGRGGTVSRIVLCGGGSKLKGLSGFIQRSLNVQCEVYDPLKNLGLAPKKVGIDYINEYREQLAVAVGNGLHIMFD